jgi:hypothetical protein
MRSYVRRAVEEELWQKLIFLIIYFVLFKVKILTFENKYSRQETRLA